MTRLFKLAATAALALCAATAAWAGNDTLMHLEGSAYTPGASSAFTVPLEQGREYVVHVNSKTGGAAFDIIVRRGLQTVALKPANGEEHVRLRFRPAQSGLYTLIVRASGGPGAFKGRVEIDD